VQNVRKNLGLFIKNIVVEIYFVFVVCAGKIIRELLVINVQLSFVMMNAKVKYTKHIKSLIVTIIEKCLANKFREKFIINKFGYL